MNLYDYLTGERIGIATDEQHAASTAADDTGAILVDMHTGAVLTPGAWTASHTTRTVYTDNQGATTMTTTTTNRKQILSVLVDQITHLERLCTRYEDLNWPTFPELKELWGDLTEEIYQNYDMPDAEYREKSQRADELLADSQWIQSTMSFHYEGSPYTVTYVSDIEADHGEVEISGIWDNTNQEWTATAASLNLKVGGCQAKISHEYGNGPKVLVEIYPYPQTTIYAPHLSAQLARRIETH